MINEDLARFSNMSVYSAMLMLVLALLTFSLHIAARTKRLAPAAATPALEPVAVGAQGSDDAVADESVVDDSVHRPDDASRASTVHDPEGEGLPLGAASRKARQLAAMAVNFTYLATGFLILASVLRGLSVHRPPLGNLFEYCLAGSGAAMLVFSAMVRRRSWEWLGAFVTGPVLAILMAAVLAFYTEPARLMPALRNVWLGIHVTIAVCALGFFTVGFALSIMQLVQARHEAKPEPAPREGRLAFLDSVPGSASLERAAYGMNIVGFILWTFTLITGAIWAQKAWGYYWHWDPKEVATFIIWVVYAAYLHARVTAGWESRRATIIGLVGYACVILNFTVVNLSSSFAGMHNYSGV